MKVQEKKGTNLPGAWIVNPKDKGRKPIKSNSNIYLENDEEFQIELFNPLKECVLADIRLNGQSISKTGLVVKPGQRFYLDCFVDDKKKFIFQTYQVENNETSMESIENNGVMEVFFYREQVVTINNWRDRLKEVVIREYYPVYPWWYPYRYNNLYNSGTGTFTTNGSGSFTIGDSNTLYSNNLTINSDITSCSFNSTSGELNLSYTSDLSNTIETGRVEKGQLSQQQFMEIDMEFEKNYIHHLVYNLLPSSRKPVEVTKKNLSDGIQATDLLIKLKDLCDAGVITLSEFNEKKKDLLSRI